MIVIITIAQQQGCRKEKQEPMHIVCTVPTNVKILPDVKTPAVNTPTSPLLYCTGIKILNNL